MVAWSGLGKRVAANLLRGDHLLVEGRLVSSTYEQPNAEGKKHTMITSWSIRADVVRRLNRACERPPAGSGSGRSTVRGDSSSQKAASHLITAKTRQGHLQRAPATIVAYRDLGPVNSKFCRPKGDGKGAGLSCP